MLSVNTLETTAQPFSAQGDIEATRGNQTMRMRYVRRGKTQKEWIVLKQILIWLLIFGAGYSLRCGDKQM